MLLESTQVALASVFVLASCHPSSWIETLDMCIHDAQAYVNLMTSCVVIICLPLEYMPSINTCNWPDLHRYARDKLNYNQHCKTLGLD